MIGTKHRYGWINVMNIVSECVGVKYYVVDYIDNFFTHNKQDINERFGYEWIGFWHLPPNIPKFLNIKNNPMDVIGNNKFQKWLPYCKGIFVFSKYLKEYLEKYINVKIIYIPYPTGHENIFDPYKKEYTILQIGYWLRHVTTIFQIDTKYNKVWLYSDNNAFVYLSKELKLYSDNEQNMIINNFKKVSIKRVNNIEYDEYLSSSILVVMFWDTSVNNIIIEAINTGTPIICNPMPAIVEKLGIKYPLYVNSVKDINEIIKKISDKEISLIDVSEYLLSLSHIYTYENFTKCLLTELNLIN